MIHIYTKERKKFVQKDGYRRKPETIEKQGMESLSQGANMAILEEMRCKKYKKTLAFFCNVRYTLNIETGLGENEVLKLYKREASEWQSQSRMYPRNVDCPSPQ